MKTKARDRVLIKLKKDFPNKWATTQELAKQLKLSREVISLYLSQLYKQGLVQKQNGRPVLWKATFEANSSSFTDVIGYDGSQSNVIRKCKAAINYPPHGLPLIITGPSGTGKSFLVSKLYQYALQQNVIDPTGELVTLNCADYANNPELLSSILFGYKKGAFTGATEDKPGLIEKANNSFIFLDEVHRLTGEGQEKLFTLLDHGIYYPVGSDSNPHKVNVRFVFATTEPLDNFLLQTLQRRVPINVELKPLSERPIWEKYQLLIHSFSEEAQQMNQDIYIDPAVFRKLIRKSYPGNIGQLKNEIKVLCAENYNNSSDGELVIGQNSIHKNRILVGQKEQPLIPKTRFIQDTFQASFDELINKFKKKENIPTLATYVYETKKKIQQNWFDWTKNNYIFFQSQLVVQRLIDDINSEFSVFTENEDELLSSLSTLLSYVSCVTLEKHAIFIKNSLLNLKSKYPRTSYMVEKHCYHLNFELSQAQKKLFTVLAIILIGEKIYKKVESVPFTCVMVAHGTGIATNIRNTVNSLCNNFIFEAFDMPIDTGTNEINQEIKKYLSQLDVSSSNGTILLFDMGSPAQLFTEINQTTHSNLLIINNLTTAIALDIAIQVTQKKQFEKIATHAETYNDTISVKFYEGLSQNNNIIISCMSGVGISEEIKKTLLKSLNNSLDIITIEYSKLKNLLMYENDTFFKNTRLILTTVDFPENVELPIINIYDILDGHGTQKFRKSLLKANFSSNQISNAIQDLVRFFSIEGVKHRLHILNPDVVINDVEQVVKSYEAFYNKRFPEKIKLNLYMHIALMLERMVLSEKKTNDLRSVSTNLTKEQKEFVNVSNHIFEPISLKYNLSVSLDEILLINEILSSVI